jgi:HNH endonuclease
MTTSDRPAISSQLEREVKMEAGFRCAIPACKQTPVMMVHIEPYRDVKSHSFDNLIALCPNCHKRYDDGQIDRKSMKLYKAKLSIINNRYGDLEQRVLTYFAKRPELSSVELIAGTQTEIQVMYAVDDGLIRKVNEYPAPGGSFTSGYNLALYELTEKGKDFINKWLSEDKEIL